MATKRPATEEVMEPADKKSKTIATTETSDDSASMPSRPSSKMSVTDDRPKMPSVPLRHTSTSVTTYMLKNIAAPFPIHDYVEVKVLTVNYQNYFLHLYTDLLNALYPDSEEVPHGMITPDEFVLVCRYLLKARVDTIYSSITGRRPQTRIPIPRDVEVPKALSDIINGVGTFIVLNGAFLVFPSPENPPLDPLTSISSLVNFNVLTRFARLINAVKVRQIVNIGYISNVSQGTGWWLLSSRAVADPSVIAVDMNTVIIRSAFKEWTPSDAFFAAVVQNQFSGQLSSVFADFWSTDNINGVASIRSAFNIGA